MGLSRWQFNDPELDELLATGKAAVLEGIGYDLIDMRDVEQAGVIDNIIPRFSRAVWKRGDVRRQVL